MVGVQFIQCFAGVAIRDQNAPESFRGAGFGESGVHTGAEAGDVWPRDVVTSGGERRTDRRGLAVCGRNQMLR